MIKKHRFTLIPNCNLISNIGNDEFALNTKLETLYLNSPVFSWDQKNISVNFEGSHGVNSAIYKKMIGIRKIHRALPIIKYIFQKIFRFHDNRGSLAHRLEEFYNREIL